MTIDDFFFKIANNLTIFRKIFKKERKCEINIEEYNNFIDNILFIYIKLCVQIKKRFDFGNTIINNLYLMNPLTIINKKSTILPLLKIWFKRKMIKKF